MDQLQAADAPAAVGEAGAQERALRRLTANKYFRELIKFSRAATAMAGEVARALREEGAKHGLSPDALRRAVADAEDTTPLPLNTQMMCILEDGIGFFRDRVTAAKHVEARLKKRSKEDEAPKPVLCGAFGPAPRGGPPIIIHGTREAVNAAMYYVRKAAFETDAPATVSMTHPSDPFSRYPALTLLMGSKWCNKLGSIVELLREHPVLDLVMCSDVVFGMSPKSCFKPPGPSHEHRAYKGVKQISQFCSGRKCAAVIGLVVEPGQCEYRKVGDVLDLGTVFEVEHSIGDHELVIRDRVGSEVARVKVFRKHLTGVA